MKSISNNSLSKFQVSLWCLLKFDNFATLFLGNIIITPDLFSLPLQYNLLQRFSCDPVQFSCVWNFNSSQMSFFSYILEPIFFLFFILKSVHCFFLMHLCSSFNCNCINYVVSSTLNNFAIYFLQNIVICFNHFIRNKAVKTLELKAFNFVLENMRKEKLLMRKNNKNTRNITIDFVFKYLKLKPDWGQ